MAGVYCQADEDVRENVMGALGDPSGPQGQDFCSPASQKPSPAFSSPRRAALCYAELISEAQTE